MSGDDEERRRDAAVRHRDAGRRRPRDRARHAGHDVVRDAGALQRQRFLAAAAEHERVAALEPHDAFAAPRGANHQRFDRALRHRMPPGALADVEALRATGVAQHAIIDERVVQDEIGAAQPRDRGARQQAGIAGACADERDVSCRCAC